MPIYEYRCDRCGAQKEYLQKAQDAPVAVCPECGSDQYRKLLSASRFQLKGSGWYATDFSGHTPKPTTEPTTEPATVAQSTTATQSATATTTTAPASPTTQPTSKASDAASKNSAN